MIQEISIKNFFSFKDKTTFSFEADPSTFRADTQVKEVNGVRLLRFAVIYGANASGKSNLMKAFFFLSHFLFINRDENGNIDYKTGVVPFMLDDKTQKDNSEFVISFFVETKKNSFTRYLYKLIVNPETVVFEELRKGNDDTIVFQRKLQGKKFNTLYNFDIEDTTKAVLDLTCRRNMSLFAAYINMEQNLSRNIEDLKNVKEYFQSFLPPITGKKDIYKYLQEELANDKEGKIKKDILAGFKTSDFNINDISFKWKKDGTVQDDFYVKGKNQKKYLLPGDLQSEGTKRYMGLRHILNQLIEKQSFLIADEMETFIHPDLYEKIVYDFLTAKDNHSQLILTTHYSGLMETVNNLIRVDSIHFVEKHDDGSSELYRLTDFDDLEKFNDKDLTIYKGYREGRFGAVANIKYEDNGKAVK